MAEIGAGLIEKTDNGILFRKAMMNRTRYEMKLHGKNVKHKLYGIGIVEQQDANYIVIKFNQKTIRISYPSAFETFLRAEDETIQNEILQEVAGKKAADDEKQRAEKEAKAAENMSTMQTANTTMPQKQRRKKSKDIDSMFSKEYHAEKLAREPILTYQEVERQFGIRIAGFGRGINPTENSVVLISSIGKKDGKFVYHDHWTVEGDYIYSGEGKSGDQSMTRGNLAIKNAAADGKALHLFVKFSPREYYYQGVFEVVEENYVSEMDEDGAQRMEYQFRLRKKEG